MKRARRKGDQIEPIGSSSPFSPPPLPTYSGEKELSEGVASEAQEEVYSILEPSGNLKAEESREVAVTGLRTFDDEIPALSRQQQQQATSRHGGSTQRHERKHRRKKKKQRKVSSKGTALVLKIPDNAPSVKTGDKPQPYVPIVYPASSVQTLNYMPPWLSLQSHHQLHIPSSRPIGVQVNMRKQVNILPAFRRR